MKKRKILKGYKVVCRDSCGENWSAWIRGPARTLYKRKIWTRRWIGCGPYAVFKTLFEAKLFKTECLSSETRYRIYVCDYELSKEVVLFYARFCRTETNLPPGTAFADKVRILTIAK